MAPITQFDVNKELSVIKYCQLEETVQNLLSVCGGMNPDEINMFNSDIHNYFSANKVLEIQHVQVQKEQEVRRVGPQSVSMNNVLQTQPISNQGGLQQPVYQ